ncbi:hypothetical protein LPW26_07120 [Rhodopseudomonas sp. HC1]|uniref:hypothetical protein n=1 Tax=Rhodopseudomonas infernalis TaxID=2897386 RepID=UPI001EE93E25|nr:hypothetical protein [Rhodopseudomonas infernalis]MCG6204399.1 hypothetical protein [Rhodopseudomonas infernalis]
MPIALMRIALRRTAIISLGVGLWSSVAAAAEPSGCAAFKWPAERERAVLGARDTTQAASGSELASLPAIAITLSLRPSADAALPTPPERPSPAERFAGFVRIKQIGKPGLYTVALSSGGWVDAVQNGHLLRPADFSGATDCNGLRKLVRYRLVAGELSLQFSGVGANAIRLAIVPAD